MFAENLYGKEPFIEWPGNFIILEIISLEKHNNINISIP